MEKKDRLKLALGEAEEAVEQVKSGRGVVELSPQSAYIRRLQHLIAEKASVFSKSLGKDPHRRVTIYKEPS
jgi:predicted RNA-binding protein Jag